MLARFVWTLILVVPVSLAASRHASGVAFDWTLGANGNWNTAANWTPAGFPNSLADTARIVDVTTVQVTVPAGATVTAGGIVIGAGDSLALADNSLLVAAGTIQNDGLINLNAVGSTTSLRLQGDTSFQGLGRLRLNSDVGTATLSAGGNFLATNASTHTLEGEGSIGGNTAKIRNLGLVDANANGASLVLDPRNAGTDSFLNENVAQASAGGRLVLSGSGGGGFTGGIFRAQAGSEVILDAGADVRGATFETVGSGIVKTADGQNIFVTNVTNRGPLLVGNNTDLKVEGTLSNSGMVTLDSKGSPSDFELGSDVILNGGGSLVFSGAVARVNAVGNFLLTNVNNTIRGTGDLGGNTARIRNQSLIDANVNGAALVLDPRSAGTDSFLNENVAQSSAGGRLVLSGSGGGGFTGGTYRAQAGSEVILDAGADVRGATFETVGSGIVKTTDGQNITFTNVTNRGPLFVGNNTDLRGNGVITNSGVITLDSKGAASDFELGSDVILNGGGSLVFSGPVARVNSVGNFLLTNVNNTIRGAGDLGGNTARVRNQSVVDANVNGASLVLDPRSAGNDAFLNENVAQASAGGRLVLSGAGGGGFTGGFYRALAGSEVILDAGADIHAATFQTVGSGIVKTTDGQNITINNVTNQGPLFVGNNTDLRANGTINNSGVITLDSKGSASDFELGSDVILQGGGSFVFSGAVARVNATGNFLLTNVNNTIRGTGDLGGNTARILNQSLVVATGTDVLRIDPRSAGANSFQNTGVVRSEGTGVIEFTGSGGGGFTNLGQFSVNGTMRLVGSASVVNDAFVTGTGTLDASGGTFTNASEFSPGAGTNVPGVMNYSGVFQQDGPGRLVVEMNGISVGSSYDQLRITGTADLSGGVLSPVLGFTPSSSQVFTVLTTTGGITSTFRNTQAGKVTLPFAKFDVSTATGNVVLSNYAATSFACDLTGDGNVDASDAGLMFSNWASTNVRYANGDCNEDGIIDAGDAGVMFAEWTGDSFPVVPEPATGWLALGCVASLTAQRRR